MDVRANLMLQPNLYESTARVPPARQVLPGRAWPGVKGEPLGPQGPTVPMGSREVWGRTVNLAAIFRK